VHWLVFYDVVDDYIERREQFRAEHRRRVYAAHQQGLLVMGGALAEPADGAVIVFEADSPGPVEEWIRDDPYVQNGLVTSWKVRKWSVGTGAP